MTPAAQNNRERIQFDVANAPGDGRVVLKIIDKDETAGSEKLIAQATFTREDGTTETRTLDLLAGGTALSTVLGDFTYGPGSSSLFYPPLAQSFAIGDELEYLIGQTSQTRIVGHYGDLSELSNINFRAFPDTVVNASVLMTVENVNSVSGTIRVNLRSAVLRTDGTTQSRVQTVTLAQGGTQTQLDASLLGFAYSYNIDAVDLANIHIGDKLTYNITGSSDDADSIIVISGSQTPGWPQNWIGPDGDGVTDLPLRYAVNTQQIQGKTVGFSNFYINSKTGEVYYGTVNIKFNASGTTGGGTVIGPVTDGKTLGSFEVTYVGQEAQGDVKLRDLNRFWDAQGVFMLVDPQTITLTQGDGRRVGVTLYGGDTVEELRQKLNDAISFGLGQGKYLPGPEARFVSFVEDPEEDSLESVRGTFVIRSIIAGEEGRISFAGSENLLNALGLNVIQEAVENDFTVTISDAHSGNIIVGGAKITGSMLVGVLHPNVDVAFDPMANIEAEWDERGRSFRLLKRDELYETFLHIADSSTVLQIGANEGEDAAVDVGNMSAEALGVLKVTVTDRESAARGITIVDNAIDRVSKQRAKIGAFQNRLEHTISNLVVASTNMTASESRIRDTDMAQTAMNLARLQILSQAGTSMLAQANLIPQNVLSLIQ
jgi:flagellin